METIEKPKVERPKANPDSPFDHLYCECDDNLSLCGLDISDLENCGRRNRSVPVCAVCEDLEDVPCLTCGE